jgi:hypothetical protein
MKRNGILEALVKGVSSISFNALFAAAFALAVLMAAAGLLA